MFRKPSGIWYNGKRVNQPAALVILFAILLVFLLGAVILPIVVLTLLFFAVALHFVLRLFGRRGFCYKRKGDTRVWKFTESFDRL